MATMGEAVAYSLKCAGKAALELTKEQLEALTINRVTLLRRRGVSPAILRNFKLELHHTMI